MEFQFNTFAFMCGIFLGVLLSAWADNSSILWIDIKYLILDIYDRIKASSVGLYRWAKDLRR